MKVFSTMLFYATMIVAVACAVWATLIEPRNILFKEHPIYVKDWPAELSGFTIVFITDPHVGSLHITLEAMQKVVEQTNALQPDLILLGGDYVVQNVVGGHPVPSKDIVAVLSSLRARHGVYGVLGNHDWWEDAERIAREFEDHHIPMLEDKAQRLTVGMQNLWVVGISDYNEGAHDVERALSSVDDDSPIIALTHSPDVFPELPARIGLTLAGHTHGGQVYVPFLGRPIVPSKYRQRYVLGLKEENGKQLFVGAGIGTSILPLRFMTPPEVSILKLYPKQHSHSAI
jgi:uncharacterized protein